MLRDRSLPGRPSRAAIALVAALSACSEGEPVGGGSPDGGGANGDGGPSEMPRTVTCTRARDSASRETLRRCGPPANRVNLVFIGDGFTEAELPSWAQKVDALLAEILDTAAPYDRYRNFLNVYRVDIASAQSGIDQPDKGITVDTALDGTNSCVDWMKGMCQIDWKKAHAAIAAATSGIAVDWRLIGLHTSIHLGATHYPPEGTLAVYPTDNPDTFHIAIHEGGHGFHRLGDEYVNQGQEAAVYNGGEPSWPNLTLDPTGAKWQRWRGFAQPDLGGPVGAYEGGGASWGKGIFRPSPQSRMNRYTYQLDAIGKETAIRSIYARVRPIDEHRDNAADVRDCQPLWLRVVDPRVLRVQWFVDGKLVEGAAGESLDACALGLAAGTHTVRARAWDEVIDHAFSDDARPHALDLVREGLEALEQSVEWRVVRP